YNFSDIALGAFLSEFKQYGGAGMEVVTGSHTVDQYAQYAKVANQYGLLASRGSDFHAPAESKVDLGTLPPLPVSVTPVWHNW
ncbi:MAG: phosphatase, partial [Burkholderiaceae bacterium]